MVKKKVPSKRLTFTDIHSESINNLNQLPPGEPKQPFYSATSLIHFRV